MPNKSLWDVNKQPAARMKRLRIVHVIWMILSVVAAASGLLGGASGAVILFGLVAAMLPGAVGAIMLTPDMRTPLVDPFLVISWTLFATMGLAMTGGAASPMTIVFAIGPLVAISMGQRKMAGEAAIFAVGAYVCVAIVDALGGLSVDVPGVRSMGGALSLGAMMLTALLVWTLVDNIDAALQSLLAEQEGALPDMEESAAAQAEDARDAASDVPMVTLPAHGGVLLLDVAPAGRVRGCSGDHLGLDRVKPGKVFTELFEDKGGADMPLAHPETWMRVAVLENGRAVDVYGEPYAGGVRIVLKAASAADDGADDELKVAQEKLSSRTAFFASLGHDLKTPLNAILGYSDMMRSGIRGPMPEPYADYPDIIHESGQDLLLLVEDILDLAKAEADGHRLDVEPIDLSASGQSVMRQLENQAERAGVKLKQKNELEVWAEADARAVRQIWQNLVSNAIKYSARDGVVTLDTREENNAAVLSVKDTGAGMTPEDLARATQPFAQGANAKGRMGTGLGLAVVKRFAELHGGMLDIQTAPGKGTKVEVSLPLADMSDIEPLEEAAE